MFTFGVAMTLSTLINGLEAFAARGTTPALGWVMVMASRPDSRFYRRR